MLNVYFGEELSPVKHDALILADIASKPYDMPEPVKEGFSAELTAAYSESVHNVRDSNE